MRRRRVADSFPPQKCCHAVLPLTRYRFRRKCKVTITLGPQWELRVQSSCILNTIQDAHRRTATLASIISHEKYEFSSTNELHTKKLPVRLGEWTSIPAMK